MTNSKSPLFSVILPTLGKVDQWSEAIRSVVDQTFSEWELIAVDSGDSEIGSAIVENFHDERITYVNTSAGNPRLNWDTGYRHAHGRYILWLDDDNYLLPHALGTLARVIAEKGSPDIVTAEHMHYRGDRHYISSQHNQLVIPLPLFTGDLQQIDPHDIVRRLMGWPQLTDVRARFHMSETGVRKEIADELISKIGEINFETTSTHALRLGVLALSQSVYVLDTPITLVGQAGHALSYTWPRIDSPVLKHVKYNLSLSPLSVLTYSNYRLENMLRTKARLGPALANIEPNMLQFVSTYRRELIAFDQPWRSWRRSWKQLFDFIESQPSLAELKTRHLKFQIMGFVAQTLRSVGLYQLFLRVTSHGRISKKKSRAIALDNYDVNSMRTCAEKLPQIIEQELHTRYNDFIKHPRSI